jgi:uncharacterized protein CbrC (UPF0167 family)
MYGRQEPSAAFNFKKSYSDKYQKITETFLERFVKVVFVHGPQLHMPAQELITATPGLGLEQIQKRD